MKQTIRMYHNGVLVWKVGIKSKVTGEKSYLLIPAPTNDEATGKAVGLFGAANVAAYEWTGTGPAYEEVDE